MKALVISFTKDKAKLIYGGDRDKARAKFKKANVGDVIELWDASQGIVHRKKGSPKKPAPDKK